MGYKHGFPGMTKFQAENGGKGLSGLSGIVPFIGNKPGAKLFPDTRKK